MLLTCTTDKKLKAGVINLHKRWVRGEDYEMNRMEKDSIEEHKLNREHLEQANASLKTKIKNNSKNNKEKNARILKDNVDLINQINALKKEQHLIH